MNIAGALVKGVLQQPVHYVHNVLIVGLRVFKVAQFQQLFKIGDARGPLAAGGAGDRARQRVKLHPVAFNIAGQGHHAADAALADLHQLLLPAGHKRLAHRHGEFIGVIFTQSKSWRLALITHHIGQLCHLHFHGVYMKHCEAGLLGDPGGERHFIEVFAGPR